VETTDKYAELLANWSVKEEQNRADFLDFLYWVYERDTGLYTGLWQQFCEDIAVATQQCFNTDQTFIEAVVEKVKSRVKAGTI
jgi:hypothetical protein